MPGVRDALLAGSDRSGYYLLKLATTELKTAILGHPDFTAFTAKANKLFAKWKKANIPHLTGFPQDGHPKALIEVIAEDLLNTFEKSPLLDPYDIYQHLMDYWAETMQDDCYLIAADGWVEAAKPRLIVEEKGKKTKVTPDFVFGKKKYQAELIPPALIIARYFSKEQAAIEALEAQAAAVQQQMEELAEEHGGEGGLLEEAKNDKDKLTRASVAARLKEVKTDPDAADERQVLQQYVALSDQGGEAFGKLNAAQEVLIEQVAAKYRLLAEDDVKTLVVDDKWLSTLAAVVQGELDRVSQTLTGRIRQLAERYATPLPQLIDEVATLAARVDEHLKKMGAVWD